MAGQITATSTTDDKAAVQAALDATQQTQAQVEADLQAEGASQTPAGETPPGDGVTITPKAKTETPTEGEPPAGETPPVAARATEGDDEDAEEDYEPPAKPPSRKERIERLKHQRWQLRQENERLQRQLAALNQPAKTDEPVAPKFSKPKPKLDQFETIEKWTEALSDWTEQKVQFDLDQRDLAVRSRIEADSRSHAESELMSRHLARVNEFKKTHPDFDAVTQEAIEQGTHEKLTPPMNVHILHSEMGPQLMLHFARHPEDAERIAALPLGPAMVAMGRLEAKLESTGTPAAPTAPAVRPTPKPAPKPIKPISNSATATTQKHPDEMTQAEYKEFRRRGGGKAPLSA